MKIDNLENGYEQPKTRNLVLMVMLVAGLPLLFIGFIILNQFGDAYRTKITDHLTVLVRKHSRTIDTFLTDRLGDIRVLARSHVFEELADQLFLTKKLAILREEHSGVFVDLGLIDPNGTQQAYSGPFNLAKADYADAIWFSEAQKNQHYISDVFTGLRGLPHFIIAVKVPWKDQGWILRATVDFNAFNALVSNIRIGKTGFAYIVNRAGELQTNPKFEFDDLSGSHRRFLDTSLEFDNVLIAESPDAFDTENIFAVSPLNNGRWILIFQQEISDAFAIWNKTKFIAILLLLFWAAVVALFTYFMSRRMTLQIEQERMQKEKMSDQVVEAGRLASIGELAAGIAHEINNPVAIMVEEAGWIQDLLAEDNPATADNLAEIERASAQIKNQGGRCKEITHKLLSFARKTDPTAKEVDLKKLVEEIITLVDQKTRYANVEIETVFDENLPPLWASATELQQVLLNLLNNSVDAMTSNGGIIKISTHASNGQITLTVADNGIGIAEANLCQNFRSVLHHQARGAGNRSRPLDLLWDYQKIGGRHSGSECQGQGHNV